MGQKLTSGSPSILSAKSGHRLAICRMSAGGTHDRKVLVRSSLGCGLHALHHLIDREASRFLPWWKLLEAFEELGNVGLRRHHHKQMLHAPELGNALLWSYVAAYAFTWDGITLLAPIATDREAAHVQVAVVQSFASEVPQRATLARIMAAMGLSREVRSSCASRRYASWV